jgi:predicted DNA-binding ribbon-helix-helix protein
VDEDGDLAMRKVGAVLSEVSAVVIAGATETVAQLVVRVDVGRDSVDVVTSMLKVAVSVAANVSDTPLEVGTEVPECKFFASASLIRSDRVSMAGEALGDRRREHGEHFGHVLNFAMGQRVVELKWLAHDGALLRMNLGNDRGVEDPTCVGNLVSYERIYRRGGFRP